MEQTPHILVVDDDREIRDLLARFLEEKHHMRVTAVRDAKEARRAFANGHYHLVVLDLMLPASAGSILRAGCARRPTCRSSC